VTNNLFFKIVYYLLAFNFTVFLKYIYNYILLFKTIQKFKKMEISHSVVVA
jgi:hypothetical protein